MANKKHLQIIKQGTDAWDRWREKNLEVKPDLSEANLSGENLGQAELSGANLSRADLRKANLGGANLNWAELTGANLAGADLSGAYLSRADLKWANLAEAKLAGADLLEANLSRADLSESDLSGADLRGTDLREANFSRSNLGGANLSGADLRNANLSGAALRGTHLSEANLSRADLSGAYLESADLMNASLSETNLEEAVLTDCRVYGLSSWGVNLNRTQQSNLILTPHGDPIIGVDQLEMAQFLYLLLYREKLRDAVGLRGKKMVLLLGRFSAQRKSILKALKEELQRRGFSSILLDFEPPVGRNLTEAISLLFRISRFVIADITDPKSIPPELQEVLPTLPSVPVQPLLQEDSAEDEKFGYFRNCPGVLKTHRYVDLDDFLPSVAQKVIEPAERLAKILQPEI